MKKRILISLMIAGIAVIVLGGCNFSPFSQIGFDSKLYSADGDGHFKETIEYITYSSTYVDADEVQRKRINTYSEDGTFTYAEYYLEENGLDLNANGTADEGYVQVRGIKAVYTYDNKTYIMTRESSKELGWWTDYEWEDDKTTTIFMTFLFENYQRDCYEQTANGIEFVYTESNPEDDYNFTYTETVVYAAGSDTLTITRTGESEQIDWQDEEVYTVSELRPEGVDFMDMKHSDIITFASSKREFSYSDWDDTAGELAVYSEGTDYGWQNRSFMKVKDYYIYSPASLDRNYF